MDQLYVWCCVTTFDQSWILEDLPQQEKPEVIGCPSRPQVAVAMDGAMPASESSG